MCRMLFHRKHLAALIMLSFFMLFFPAPTSAQGDGKVVRVGWYESPFNLTDRFGRRSGYAYDYQQKIAAYTGWTYEFVNGSWPELYEMLRAGRIDLLSDVSYTPERTAEMLFSNAPMGAETYMLFVAASNADISIQNLATLNGKKIGVNKNSIQAKMFRDWMLANGINAQLIEMTESEAAAITMIETGAIDGYVTLDSFEDMNNHACVPLVKIGQSEYFFVVNKNRPDLLNELNAAMNKINDENRFFNNQMYDKYLKRSGTNAFISTDGVNWLAQHGTIRVGYPDDYTPFCTRSMTGDITGALKDYLTLAAKSMKNATLDFKTQAYPTLRDALTALNNGEIDCVFPIHLSAFDADNLNVMVTNPFVQTEIYMLMRKDVQPTISADSDMVIAVDENNSNDITFVRDHFPNSTLLNCKGIDECLSAVESSRADGLIINNYQVTQPRFNDYNLYALTTGSAMDFSFAVRKSDHALYYVLSKSANLVPNAAIHSALTEYSTGRQFSLTDFLRNHIFLVLVSMMAIALLGVLGVHRKAKRKEQELKDRMAIQNQKLENERRMHEVDSMISAVAADYRSVYSVDLVRDEGLCYRAKTNSGNAMSDLPDVKKGDWFPFREKFMQYVNTYVAEPDRAGVLKFIEPENIRAKLAHEIMTAHRYRTIRDGEEHYEMLRIVDFNLGQNRKNAVDRISIGFAEVDSETRELMERNRALTEALKKATA